MSWYSKIKPYKNTIIGCTLIIVLAYIAKRSKIIEGFDPIDSEERPAEIKRANTKTTDMLNITKYRSNYEDIIKHKMKWCDNQILSHLVSNKLDVNEPLNDKNNQLIAGVNGLSNFKNTLKDSLKYLDSQ